MSQLDEVAAALQKGGLSADTPAAILQSATMENERVVESTLSKLVADACDNDIGSPAIVVIGAIAGLRQQLLAGLVGWR
jgi:uroporphyrin-III C-methyltransferase